MCIAFLIAFDKLIEFCIHVDIYDKCKLVTQSLGVVYII